MSDTNSTPSEPLFRGPMPDLGHISAEQLLKTYNSAYDAEAQEYPFGSLGSHALGQMLRQTRHYLADMARLNLRLSVVDLQAVTESAEGLAELQSLLSAISDLPQQAQALTTAATELHTRVGWTIPAVQSTLAQREQQAKAELLRQKQEAEEQARQQLEAEQQEQAELGRLARLMQKLGFHLPEERTKS